jgi:NADPH:quinone reductase-like Zn-dependent oxidoreductase
MKAIAYRKYGPPHVLKLEDLAKPVPQDGEVLVKIHAASINSRDWRLMRANPFFIRIMAGGLLRPKNPLLGADLAGWVEMAGRNVRQFQPGAEVFGCISAEDRGTFAEYVCVKESDIVLKPANISFEQAAAVPLAALTALQGLQKGNLQAGQKVLIQGASGGVGTFAVQIAKALGTEVTAVCSTRNLNMVRSLGADHVIDYKKEDFTRNRQRYDLILAANGYHPISDYLRALSPDGTYVVAGGSMFQLFQAALRGRKNSQSGGQRVYVVSQVKSQQDLLFMKELLESGKVVPVIDECYPLSKAVEAFQYFEKVHPRGKVVIMMDNNNKL